MKIKGKGTVYQERYLFSLYKCHRCKYKFKDAIGCKAFPAGIPEKILEGKFSHKKKYPGQLNNVVFEPIDS